MSSEDSVEWNNLYADWQQAKDRLEVAQNALDTKFKDSLEGKGKPPTKNEMEELDDLTFQVAEKRGHCDQFISERLA